MDKNTKHLGNFAEKISVSFLRKRNYLIISRNYLTKKGEIDIIAYDRSKQEIAFVEVRSRWIQTYKDLFNKNLILPEDSINTIKLKKIEKTAWHFLEKENLKWEPYFRDIAPYAFPNWRIDLITIIVIKSIRKIKIKHYKYVIS